MSYRSSDDYERSRRDSYRDSDRDRDSYSSRDRDRERDRDRGRDYDDRARHSSRSGGTGSYDGVISRSSSTSSSGGGGGGGGGNGSGHYSYSSSGDSSDRRRSRDADAPASSSSYNDYDRSKRVRTSSSPGSYHDSSSSSNGSYSGGSRDYSRDRYATPATGGGYGGGGGSGGKEICRTFKNTGSCRYGAACRHLHEGAAPSGVGNGSTTSSSSGASWQPPRTSNLPGYSGSRADASPRSDSMSDVSLPSFDLAQSAAMEDEPGSEWRQVEPLGTGDVAARKEPGELGKASRCVSNMFHINFTPREIFLYVVEFPDTHEPTMVSQRHTLFNTFRSDITKLFSAINFFDGATLISANNVDLTTLTNENGQSITIKPNKHIPTSDVLSPEVNAIVNKLMKQLLRAMNLIQFNRSYFDPAPIDIGGLQQLQMYQGFFCSVNPTIIGLQLNVDLAHRVLHKRSVREVMREIEARCYHKYKDKDSNALWKAIIQEVTAELKNNVILTAYNKRVYRINAVDYSLKLDSTFTMKDGTTKSFREYYRETYHQTLPEKNLPGMLMHQPKQKSAASPVTPIYLVPDLCYLTGVNDKMRSDGRLMQTLASFTRYVPSTRAAKVAELIQQMLHRPNVQEALSAMPFSINYNPTEVPSRILPPVILQHARGQLTLDEKNNNFQNKTRDFGFFPPANQSQDRSIPTGGAKIDKWVALYSSGERDLARDVLGYMNNLAGRSQIRLAQPIVIEVPAEGGRGGMTRIESWEPALKKAAAENPQLIFFINPQGDQTLYSFIKGMCNVQYGIPSQCVKSDNVRDDKKRNPVLTNTLRQMLVKLDYSLWCIDHTPYLQGVDIGKGGLMMVGADACHDRLITDGFNATDARRDRSTVCFASSYDNTYTHFSTSIAFQSKNQDVLMNAKELMVNALRVYKEKNGWYPTSILIYRDGVGNSQLDTFVRQEIADFEAAFTEVGYDETPKLTVIVIQKKVTVRLFEICPVMAARKQGGQAAASNVVCHSARCDGRSEYHSPTPGTVVDSVITSSLFSDFYLVPSIAPPSATARPTRFITVRDDLGFTSDALQSLTNQCCYLYFNWPGGVRSPAITMYAHKAAYLFGKFIQGTTHQSLTNKMFYV